MRSLLIGAALGLLAVTAAPAAKPADTVSDTNTCLMLVARNIAKGKGNFYEHHRFSSRVVNIVRGNKLHYDMYLLADQPNPQGGVNITFNDGSNLMVANLAKGELDGPIRSPLDRAKGHWITRTFILDEFAGKSAVSWSIQNDWSAEGVYVQFIDNVAIETSSGWINPIYTDGKPEKDEIIASEGYSKDAALVVVPRAGVRAENEQNLRKHEALAKFSKVLDRQRMRAAATLFGREMDAVAEACRREGRNDLLALVDAARAKRPDPETYDGTPDAYLSSLKEATHDLAHLHPMMMKYTGHLVGHAHIDFQWLWEWPEGVEVARRTFTQAMNFMEQVPGFKFSQSSPALYEAMELHHPDVFERMKPFIKRGQWELVGGRWSEGDLNMPGDEAQARHFLYGQRYFREKFGRSAKVGWEPDTFGHNAQMPQLLRGAGIDSYYFCRGNIGDPLFQWEGIDGSRVLAFDEARTNSWYNSGLTGKEFAQLFDFNSKNGSKDMLWVYGVGNHGGGPTMEYLKTALDWQKKVYLPQAKFSTAADFFARLRAQKLEKIPTFTGELNDSSKEGAAATHGLAGVYTTHADMKRWNREAETTMVAAETTAAIASQFGYVYPRAEFTRTWHDILWNHHHDTLPGTSIHRSYDLSKRLYGSAITFSQRVLFDATDAIARQTSAAPGSLLVWNTLGWPRTSPVTVTPEGPLPAGALVAVGPAGAPTPVQRTADGKIAFVAHEVPAFGYRTYQIKTAASVAGGTGAGSAALSCREGGKKISTGRYDIEVDPATGAVSRLYDKAQGKEIVAGRAGDLKIHWEAPHEMSAWDIGPMKEVLSPSAAAGVELVECGPVRATVRVRREFGQSAWVQDLIVYADLDLVETHLAVDWWQRGTKEKGGPFLKVHFPLGERFSELRAAIPFGDITRPADGKEVPALGWVDTGNVALLNNNKHGHAAKDGVLSLSLIRSSYEPDPEPDLGHHDIRYALLPHAGSARDAEIPRRASEFNTAPVALWQKARGTGKLGAEMSLLSVSGKGINATALKLSEDSDRDFVLRVYAASGTGATLRIQTTLPVRGVDEVNLVEDRVTAGKLDGIKLRGYEIKTLKLKRK